MGKEVPIKRIIQINFFLSVFDLNPCLTASNLHQQFAKFIVYISNLEKEIFLTSV